MAYEKDRTDIPLDTLVIDLDFKQKIVIGDGPRQTNLTYYSQKQKSMLGFGLYYKDDNNQMKTMNVDLISDCLTEDSFYVVSAFRFIRKQDFFMKIKKSKYKIWFDTGNHFRSAEVMHYLFEELKTEISVDCNFFCEKHGKSARDQHFSVVSGFLKRATHIKRFTNIYEIADSLRKYQFISNERRKKAIKHPKPPIDSRFFVFFVPRDDTRFYLTVTNIRSYYHFTMKNLNIASKNFSDGDQLIHVRSEQTTATTDKVPKTSDNFVNPSVDINTLISKRFLIDSRTALHVDFSQHPDIKRDSVFCMIICSYCKISCTYSLDQIESLSMAKIKAELKKHNHLLQKNEAIQNKTKLENEIISHYKICHKKEN